MPILKRLSRVMESPAVYSLWQAPFFRAKFAPIRRHNDLTSIRRVLDVGCGPGTNAAVFEHTEYVGLDINPAYIERARRDYGRTFLVADVCTYVPPPDQQYDFVLVNSLLHHLDDASTNRLLQAIRDIVAPDECIHVIDLVLPDQRSIARYMAKNDRGDHPRTLAAWRQLLGRYFEPVVEEPFPVGIAGLDLWLLLYFKGRPRREPAAPSAAQRHSAHARS